jgi:NADP-dependent 3-hydroxy acid dehydrogenase YdfG
MEKTILITGASSGFGEAMAYKFAEQGWSCIITGRRKERLNNVADTIRNNYGTNVLALTFDIRSLDAVKEAIESIPENFRTIDVLVNNAGLAVGRSPIQEGIYDDWERMIDTNIKGLLYVTREVVPLMIAQGKGHIINIASLAGIESYGGGNVYCGTKHAVRAMSRGMRIDLVQDNIKVSCLSPGAADTEFSLVRYKGNKEVAEKTYEGFQPLSAEDVAESTYFIASQPEHVNIEEIFILPTAQANSTVFNRKK